MSERYDFAISLRIWHPSMSPASITRRLRLTPRIKKTAGAARRTARRALLRAASGTLLGGVNPESYWVADVIRHGVGSAGRRSSAEQHVERFCRKFVRHAEFSGVSIATVATSGSGWTHTVGGTTRLS